MRTLEAIEIEVSEAEGYGIIFLNRPNQLNALNTQLSLDFCSAIENVSKNNKIRCVIITGKGKIFSAGGDLVEFKNAKDPSLHLYNLAKSFHEGIKILKAMHAPSIAAINGACFGVGLSLACACDLRICHESAKFAVAFTSVGLSPDSSMTFHLPKIVGLPMANEMAILNRVLTAEDAKKYNLVSKIINNEENFLEEVKKIAVKISQGPTLAFGATKRLFLESFSNDLENQLEKELISISQLAATEDFQEGAGSFLEKRKANFKGK